MALHSDGGYSAPCDEVDHDLDFEAGRADAARARSSAAMYRAADERGWTLTCPTTKQAAARLPESYWGGQIVRKDGVVIHYAVDDAGHEVAGFGGQTLWGAWLPKSSLGKDERNELRDYFRSVEYRAEVAAKTVAEEAADAGRIAAKEAAEKEIFRSSGNPWAVLSALKKGV